MGDENITCGVKEATAVVNMSVTKMPCDRRDVRSGALRFSAGPRQVLVRAATRAMMTNSVNRDHMTARPVRRTESIMMSAGIADSTPNARADGVVGLASSRAVRSTSPPARGRFGRMGEK